LGLRRRDPLRLVRGRPHPSLVTVDMRVLAVPAEVPDRFLDEEVVLCLPRQAGNDPGLVVSVPEAQFLREPALQAPDVVLALVALLVEIGDLRTPLEQRG